MQQEQLDPLYLPGISQKEQTRGQRCYVRYCRHQPERICCRCLRPTCAKHGDYDEPLLFCQQCDAEIAEEREERLKGASA